LKLNTARTDVLQSDWPIWKRLRKFLQSKSDQRVKTKRTSLSEGELENLARRFVAGDLDYSEVKSVRLITDIVGRKHELETLGRLQWWSRAAEPVLTVADRGSRLGERAHQLKLAFVIAQATLERFGVESLDELLQSVRRALKADSGHNAIDLAKLLELLKTCGTVKEAVPALREGYEILKEDSLKPLELVAKSAIVVMAVRISLALVRQQLLSQKTARRKIYVGVSDEAEAWTDANTRIVIERKRLALLNEGVGGFIGMANILVHEFLHDQADLGSHTHDLEFYDRYHTATCGRAGVLKNAVQFGMQKFGLELGRRGIKIPSRAGGDLDVMEQLDEVREPLSPALSEVAPPPTAQTP